MVEDGGRGKAVVASGGGAGSVEAVHRGVMEVMDGSPMVFAKYYFGKYFRLKTPRFHMKIMEESMRSRFLAIQAPRESAKSTILIFFRVTHGIAFKRFRFIVLVQNTQKKAEGTLDGIKQEFMVNERLRNSFGVEFGKSTSNDTIFRHPDGFETRVMCFGVEQMGSIRGERFGAYRPDLIIGDDMEDDEMVKNPDRRRELKATFDDALVPAGEYGKVCVFLIGTILHYDSLIARAVSKDEYKEYRKLFFIALYKDRDGVERSLWPEKWTVEELHKMRQDKPMTFAKEMQGNPVSGVLRKFDREDFRYWRRELDDYLCFDENNVIVSRGKLSDCRGAIACDLAWEEKRQADDSVILPAYLTHDSNLLFDDYICEKGMRPDRLAEILFVMVDRMEKTVCDVVPIGFEKAKLEKVARWFLKKEMKRRNKFLWTKNVPWITDKIERITTRLQPRYKMHAVFHKRGMGKFEQQLVQFPEGVHDDICDCAQMCSYLLTEPKSKKKPVVQDDAFEKLRKFAAESRKKPRRNFIFGTKQRRFPFPVEVSPI